MSTPRTDYNPPLTKEIIKNKLFKDDRFTLFDVGQLEGAIPRLIGLELRLIPDSNTIRDISDETPYIDHDVSTIIK